MIYESSANQNDLQPFLYRPYCLFYGQRAWYVTGYSERAGAERTLKLGRLRKTETTDRPYSIPDEWSLEKTFGKAWRMMRGDRRYDVTIEFTGDCARTMADTMWHPGQKIIWKSSECCLFECEVDGLDEIIWWILSYGQHAKVLRPRELVRRVQEQLVSAARQYGVADDCAPDSNVRLSCARISTRKPALQ